AARLVARVATARPGRPRRRGDAGLAHRGCRRPVRRRGRRRPATPRPAAVEVRPTLLRAGPRRSRTARDARAPSRAVPAARDAALKRRGALPRARPEVAAAAAETRSHEAAARGGRGPTSLKT